MAKAKAPPLDDTALQEGEVLILEDKNVLDDDAEDDQLVSVKQKEALMAEGRVKEKEKAKLKYNPYEEELDAQTASHTTATTTKYSIIDTLSTLRPAMGKLQVRKRPKRALQLDFGDEPVAKVATTEADRPTSAMATTAGSLLDDDDLRMALERSRRTATKIKFAEIGKIEEEKLSPSVSGIAFEDSLAIVTPSALEEEAQTTETKGAVDIIVGGDGVEEATTVVDEGMIVEPVFEKDPLVRRGVAATLQYLAKLGIRPQLMTEAEAHKNIHNRRFENIQVIHYDEEGNVLTPKEAYKHLSHKFHGKAPGKAKKAKLQKRKEQAAKISGAQLGDTPLGLAAAQRETQKTFGTTHIVLDSRPIITSGDDQKSSSSASVRKTDKKAWPSSSSQRLHATTSLAPRSVAAKTSTPATATTTTVSKSKIFGMK